MSASEATIPSIAAEAALNLAGLILFWRWVLSPAARREPRIVALPAWDAPASDFFLYLLLAACGGIGLEMLFGWIFRQHLNTDEGRLLIGGGALQAGVLLGVAAFRFGFARRKPVQAPAPGRALVTGIATFLVLLPLLNLLNAAWDALLDACGVPVVRQELVDLLANTDSLTARITLIILAAVGAPVMEEIIFRAGLFRYLRTRLPRWAALLVPSILFGAAHGNLAAFIPFVLLGVVLSVAYERTGRIGTAMVAHSLFNLNTVAMVLLGFST